MTNNGKKDKPPPFHRKNSMIDRTHAGLRDPPCFLSCTVTGDLARHSAGTVGYAMENLRWLLIAVDWDRPFMVPMFLDAIERWCEGRKAE
jgi:hypothetical protein